MTTPIDNREFNDFDAARSDLREGIESSRQILRQSRELIELSEIDGPCVAANDDSPIAN